MIIQIISRVSDVYNSEFGEFSGVYVNRAQLFVVLVVDTLHVAV